MSEKIINRFESLSEIARLINSGDDIDAILDLIVYALCAHSDWSMSGVLIIDETAGISKTIKRYDPYQTADKKAPVTWDLATSPVAEVVRLKQPLIITNAMDTKKYPTYREDARIRGYRTAVLLPLLATDGEGRPMVLSVQSRDSVVVSERELSFLRMASDLASIAMEKAVRIEMEQKMSARLRRSVEVYTSIMQTVMEGGSLLAVSGELNRVLKQPWLIVDLTSHEVVNHKPPECFPHDEEQWKTWIDTEGKYQFVVWAQGITSTDAEKQRTMMLNAGAESFKCSAQILPLIVDTEIVGALYLFASADVHDNPDSLQIQAVRLALSAVLMRGVIHFHSTVNIQDEVVRRLFAGEWENRGEFTVRASAVGIMLNQSLQILTIEGAEKERKGAACIAPRRLLQLVARMVKELFDGHVTVEHGDAIISLLPACDRDDVEFPSRIQRLQTAIELNTSKKWILMLSEPCTNLDEFGKVLWRCKRLIALARSLDIVGLVSTKYFGSLPLLLSMADNAVVEEFLAHTIHRVKGAHPKRGPENLETLRTFVNCEGRFQACAGKLGIHVSTLRYRLEKLNDRFGIDATCADTRFDLQIAFRLHDLANSNKPTG